MTAIKNRSTGEESENGRIQETSLNLKATNRVVDVFVAVLVEYIKKAVSLYKTMIILFDYPSGMQS